MLPFASKGRMGHALRALAHLTLLLKQTQKHHEALSLGGDIRSSDVMALLSIFLLFCSGAHETASPSSCLIFTSAAEAF